jgi:hypothetical protein
MRRCRRGAHWSTSGEGGQHCDDEERRQLELTIERRRARESSGVRGKVRGALGVVLAFSKGWGGGNGQ